MEIWSALSSEQQAALLTRPAQQDVSTLQSNVQRIIESVKNEGDNALKQFNREFDKNFCDSLIVPQSQIEQSGELISDNLKAAIDQAFANITKFHAAQLPQTKVIETQPGVVCELRYQAINAVGIYVPGGTAPLPSSVLMQGSLAKLSGAETIVLATPVKGEQDVNPAILYAAKLCGVTTLVKSGGAGVISAMAYGTESIPKVNKIFGPGNSFVTMAKQLVAQQCTGLAIDMPAGPSEVLVIADSGANPKFVASDLLSQAEHGADSQVVLLSDDKTLIDQVKQEIDVQLQVLSRSDIAKQALANSPFILVESIEQAIKVSNQYGPEHLIVQTRNASELTDKFYNVGSLFVGDYTPESAGDYASGTNHVLPTYGYSQVYSALNLMDFFRTYTVQTISKQGLTTLANSILPIADAEGLDAHANAVKIRLEEQ
ncbi:histidinol dehydrogenase [Pseudoalteromonas piratica]|uniref:Histidinol dehydrogenase n=1 Tax=Pseudoalteromonas piratica TaxID=1348114 RepID=A0A0A7EK61_9GAMM|nr:histidinol dehydrogenase [Pseudoalteromonas piratica]AIY67050.1 histidinol dehydrogenase [Pseudoalteromonas piratica]